MIGDLIVADRIVYVVVFDGRQSLHGERPLLRHASNHQESTRASDSRRARACRCEQCKAISLHRPGISCMGVES